MDYTMTPHFDGRVLYVKTQGDMSIEEWTTTSQEIDQFLQESPHGRVHVVVDMLGTNRHPVNLVQIRRVTIWSQQPNLGWTVHLTNQRLTSMLGQLVIEHTLNQYKTLTSEEEAFAFLAEQDTTLQ